MYCAHSFAFTEISWTRTHIIACSIFKLYIFFLLSKIQYFPLCLFLVSQVISPLPVYSLGIYSCTKSNLVPLGLNYGQSTINRDVQILALTSFQLFGINEHVSGMFNITFKTDCTIVPSHYDERAINVCITSPFGIVSGPDLPFSDGSHF